MVERNCDCCDEYLTLSRRQFLATSGGAAIALSMPAWLPRVVYAQDFCSTRDVVIVIFLRGAADGLTLCVPHTEDAYYAARPSLAIPRPDSGSPFRAIDLNGSFGFPQALAPLVPAYQAGHLLMVHACGSTDPSRSHFDAQRFMEVGKPNDPSLFTGWLGRHLLSTAPMVPNSILRAVGIGYTLQRSLQSGPLTLPIPDLDHFDLQTNPATLAAQRQALSDMYGQVPDPLRAAAQTTQVTIDMLNTIDFANYLPAGGAVYPANGFGTALKSAAALIKADVGVEAVAVDAAGWDTHNNQGPMQGAMAGLMTSLAGGMAALHADLFAGNGRNVTIIAMSEFGRRLLESGSFGTDHGHGNAMFVLGNHIAGGRVMTQWPGLAPNQLFEGRDLAVTTDFRDILAEIVAQRLGNPNLSQVFPDYTPTFRGVTTACQSGDMNCDGVTNAGDVAPFVQAMLSPADYRSSNPACNATAGDFNGDGKLDGRDIQGFVNSVMSQ